MTTTQKRFSEDETGDLAQILIVHIGEHAQRVVGIGAEANLDGFEVETHTDPFASGLLCRHALARTMVPQVRPVHAIVQLFAPDLSAGAPLDFRTVFGRYAAAGVLPLADGRFAYAEKAAKPFKGEVEDACRPVDWVLF